MYLFDSNNCIFSPGDQGCRGLGDTAVKWAGEAQGSRGERGKPSGEGSWGRGQETIPKAIQAWLLKNLEPVTALFAFKKIFFFFEQSVPVAQ